jgi:hypothetical protein
MLEANHFHEALFLKQPHIQNELVDIADRVRQASKSQWKPKVQPLPAPIAFTAESEKRGELGCFRNGGAPPVSRPTRFLKDAFGIAKRIRSDMAAGGPERRAREAAEKEARYAAFLKSRTAADLARSDESPGLLCSTDGRLPLSAVAGGPHSSRGGAHPCNAARAEPGA